MFNDNYFNRISSNAIAIREQLSDIEPYKNGQVHFRPTSSGVTFVSLCPGSAMLGEGPRSAESIKFNFDMLYEKHCIGRTPGRPTEEKQLQAHIISEAYRNARVITFAQLGRKNTSFANMRFVTDELAVVHEDTKRLCDILGLRKKDGMMVPAVIELKSSRDMKELCEQVNTYAKVIQRNKTDFEELFSAVLGEDIKFTDKPERWIVWPHHADSGKDKREDELASKGIGLVSYKKMTDDTYMFQVGNRPISYGQERENLHIEERDDNRPYKL
jgi:hypothetical protein